MSDEREGSSGKPESDSALLEKLNAAMKAVFDCTFHEFLSGTYQVGYIAGYSQCCADERAAANRKKNLGRSGKVAARREGHWLAPILPLPRQRLEQLVKLVNHPFRKAAEAGRNVEPVRNRGRPAALISLELELLAQIAVDDHFGYTVIARIEAYQKIVRRSEYYEF